MTDAADLRRDSLASSLEWRIRRLGGYWSTARVVYARSRDDLGASERIRWRDHGYYFLDPIEGEWLMLGRHFPRADAVAWGIIREARRPERTRRARDILSVVLEVIGVAVPIGLDVADAVTKRRRKD